MLLSKIEGGIFDSSRKRTLACRPLNFLRLSKIDQHPAPGAAQTTPSPLRQWHFIGDREFGNAPAASHGRHLLLDPQASTLSHRAAARPRCPKCQSRMEVQRITAARPGFEHWTLRCVKCGLINEAQVSTDPMKSDAIGWVNSDLRTPE
jgi:ribosomal protein L37AE/L43A